MLNTIAELPADAAPRFAAVSRTGAQPAHESATINETIADEVLTLTRVRLVEAGIFARANRRR